MSGSRNDLILDVNECPCGGGNLDKLVQPAILAILIEGPLHGYALAERIGKMPISGGHSPDVTGVYRFLKWMENNGLVVSSWDLSESGPARKSYQITSAGRKCLSHWIETLEQYRQGITDLLKTARKAVAGRADVRSDQSSK